MHFKMLIFRAVLICMGVLWVPALLADHEVIEDIFVAHVKRSIENAEKGISKLSPEVLKIEGMSSPKVRHLLNNLCSMPGTNYLEVGLWKGSTWVAALFKNESIISSAIGIDNWSQLFGSQEDLMAKFMRNCSVFLLNSFPHQVYSADCFKINVLQVCPNPVTVYFYDGDHHVTSQEKAFTHFNPILDKIFIAVIDDWETVDWGSGQSHVQMGKKKAFAKLNYQVLFEVELKAEAGWWNGLYIAVVKKKR